MICLGIPWHSEGVGGGVRASTITKTHYLFNAFKKDMVSEWGGLEGDNRDNRDLKKAVSKPNILGLEMEFLMFITGITGT